MISLLRISDLNTEFVELLSYLSPVTSTFDELENEYFDKRPNDVVIVYRLDDKLVGTATLHLENKFTHNCSMVGHLEDVVVHPSYRNRNIGKELIEHLVAVARSNGCRKILLNCSEDNVGFYESCGFRRHEVSMRMDLRELEPPISYEAFNIIPGPKSNVQL